MQQQQLQKTEQTLQNARGKGNEVRDVDENNGGGQKRRGGPPGGMNLNMGGIGGAQEQKDEAKLSLQIGNNYNLSKQGEEQPPTLKRGGDFDA